MKNRERFVIYALLAVLIAVNVRNVVDGGARSAHAAPRGDELGPAEALVLTGGDGDLILRTADKRLAWGDAAHQRTYSVAYVFIGSVLNQLMKSEELQEDRDRLAQELEETQSEFQERLDSVGTMLQGMDPESEEAKRVYENGSVIYKEFMAWQQEAIGRRGKLEADHLERVYREMIEAVEVVAERKNIDTVYRFIPTGDPFNANNPDQAMTAIRLRSALRYPDELDITDDVLEELSLDIE